MEMQLSSAHVEQRLLLTLSFFLVDDQKIVVMDSKDEREGCKHVK